MVSGLLRVWCELRQIDNPQLCRFKLGLSLSETIVGIRYYLAQEPGQRWGSYRTSRLCWRVWAVSVDGKAPSQVDENEIVSLSFSLVSSR